MSGTRAARGRPIHGNRWDELDGLVPDPLPLVSVIVAHYRQPEQLARTLAALAASDYPRELVQIIVADDGSPQPPTVPDGVELVRQADEGFRLAAVRNLGVRAARGDVLVFVDADTAPEPGYLRALTRLPALAPDCVTVGRRRHADLAEVAGDRIATDAPAHALTDPVWLDRAYRDSADLLYADDRSYRHVIGAVIACARELFDATGGFDETFTTYGGEDWEWVYRAWLQGAALAHVRDAVAWHDGPDAAGRDDGDRRARNAEAVKLSDLIPVPGSAGRGIRPTKVDIGVRASSDASEAQRFVGVDSTLAGLGAAAAELPRGDAAGGHDGTAFDRVRIEVDLLVPLRVRGDDIARAVARVGDERLGSLTLRSPDGAPLVRVSSTRARARAARWQRDDLFATVDEVARGIEVLAGEPDVAAYVGGWG